MDKKLHFLMTSEKGETRSFAISKIVVRNILIAALLLAAGGVTGWLLTMENAALRLRVSLLQENLDSTLALNQEITTRAVQKDHEQESLLQNALHELRQRSQLIESILSSIGVKLEVRESSENAGGPFAALPGDSYEDLTLKVDHYLETISSVPLGPPAAGTITSTFGRRNDPFNGEAAFHSGVDIKNEPGTRIIAPADGVVASRGYNEGFGNYLVIDHGHSFGTRYLHLQKSLVNEGDRVKRGQTIGLIGNSGRSTGPHLHYEINYRDRAINPIKFMHIASQISPAQNSTDSSAAAR